MTARQEPVHRCYLCEQALSPDEQAEHFEQQHAPRLLVPTGHQLAEGATVRALFQQSADWPVLAADVMVLLHHGAAACGSALEGIQGDAPVGACLQELDDAVAALCLARQVLTDAVRGAGVQLPEPGMQDHGFSS